MSGGRGAVQVLLILLGIAALPACLPGATGGQIPPRSPAAARERETPEPVHRVHSRAADLAPAVRPPTNLSIPSIGVEAQVEQVNFLGVPRDPGHVAWFRTGAAPGEPGTATFDGHLDWSNGPAVFWNLSKVQPGDEIRVGGANGERQEWRVDLKQSVPYTSSPPEWLYASSGPPRISLITCGGTWLGAVYADRLLIRAVPRSG